MTNVTHVRRAGKHPRAWPCSADRPLSQADRSCVYLRTLPPPLYPLCHHQDISQCTRTEVYKCFAATNPYFAESECYIVICARLTVYRRFYVTFDLSENYFITPKRLVRVGPFSTTQHETRISYLIIIAVGIFERQTRRLKHEIFGFNFRFNRARGDPRYSYLVLLLFDSCKHWVLPIIHRYVLTSFVPNNDIEKENTKIVHAVKIQTI